METIKRNKSREMKSITRTATLKHTVYEGDDIRFRISDSHRFFFSPSLSVALPVQESTYKIRQRSPSKKLTVPRTCSRPVEIKDRNRRIYAMSRDLN